MANRSDGIFPPTLPYCCSHTTLLPALDCTMVGHFWGSITHSCARVCAWLILSKGSTFPVGRIFFDELYRLPGKGKLAQSFVWSFRKKKD